MSKGEGIAAVVFGIFFVLLGLSSLLLYPALLNLVQVLAADPALGPILPEFGLWAPPFFSVYGLLLVIPFGIFLSCIGGRILVGVGQTFRDAADKDTLGKSIMNGLILIPLGVLIMVFLIPASLLITMGGMMVAILIPFLFALGPMSFFGTFLVMIFGAIIGIVAIVEGVKCIKNAPPTRRSLERSHERVVQTTVLISPDDTKCPRCGVWIDAADIQKGHCPSLTCGALFKVDGEERSVQLLEGEYKCPVCGEMFDEMDRSRGHCSHCGIKFES